MKKLNKFLISLTDKSILIRTKAIKEYMKNESMSNPAENLAKLNPRELFSSVPTTYRKIFGYLLDASVDLKTLFFSQTTLGEAVGRGRHTGLRAAKFLEQIGLIYKDNRNYDTCIYSINPIVLSQPWHKELWHWFRRYPAMILNLSLLISAAGAKCNTMISGEDLSIKQQQHLIVSKGQELLLSDDKKGLGVEMSVKSRFETEQFDGEQGKKVRNIALALNKRGANLTSEEALSLFAYDKAVLDRVCKVMKESKGIKSVSSFFFGLCNKFSIESNKPKDWDLVRHVSSLGLKVLHEHEEGMALHVPVTENVKESGAPKAGTAQYNNMDRVKQTMADEAEARAKRVAAIETEASLRLSISQLEEKISKGCQFSGWALKSVKDTLEEFLKSNTAKDSTISHGDTAPIVQNVSPVADLNQNEKSFQVSAITGEVYEEDLRHSGQHSSFAQSTFI